MFVLMEIPSIVSSSIVLLLVIGMVAFAIRSMIIQHKKGGCSGCPGCSSGGVCPHSSINLNSDMGDNNSTNK